MVAFCPSGEMVDAVGSNPAGEIREGSSPSLDTRLSIIFNFKEYIMRSGGIDLF